MSDALEKRVALKLACAIVADSPAVYVTHEELKLLKDFTKKSDGDFVDWMTKMGVPCMMRKGKPMQVIVKGSNSPSLG